MHGEKFLLVCGFPDSIIKFRGALIDALLSRGLIVHVAGPNLPSSSPIRLALEAKKVQVHEIPLVRASMNPVTDLTLMWNLIKLMMIVKPTIVMAYTIKPVIYASLASRFARVPRRFALVTGLGYAFTDERRGLLKRMASFLYSIALRKINGVFFQNPDDEKLFRDRGIISGHVRSVVVNGSGVDTVDFSVKDLPTNELSFLLIGRLLGNKGVREYVQAARRIRDTHPNIRFRLAGWIDDSPDAIFHHELNAWIDEGTVEFLGQLEDVKRAISECAVFVLPSYREGTPRTVLEAMAMGRPIVTTDAPGCREAVVDGENGFLVTVKSIDELTFAMLRFVNDASLAPRMGLRSRQIAEEKYDVHLINEVMLREMGI